MNGRFTCKGGSTANASYEDAKPQQSANYWASTENSRNNAWNVNSNDGNTNGNNKYNSLTVMAAVAYGGFKEAISSPVAPMSVREPSADFRSEFSDSENSLTKTRTSPIMTWRE